MSISFFAYKNANQTVTAASETLLTFENKLFDTHGYFDLSTERFVPLTEGYYQLNLLATCENTTLCFVTLFKNGTKFFQNEMSAPTTNHDPSAVANVVVHSNGVDDYFEAKVTNFDGTIIRGSQIFQTQFSGAYVGDQGFTASSSPYYIDVGSSVMLGGILAFLVAYWVVGLTRSKLRG